MFKYLWLIIIGILYVAWTFSVFEELFVSKVCLDYWLENMGGFWIAMHLAGLIISSFVYYVMTTR